MPVGSKYYRVPPEILKDGSLKTEELLTLIMIYMFSDSDGWYTLGWEELADKVRSSSATVRRHVRDRLEPDGWVERHHEESGGRKQKPRIRCCSEKLQELQESA